MQCLLVAHFSLIDSFSKVCRKRGQAEGQCIILKHQRDRKQVGLFQDGGRRVRNVRKLKINDTMRYSGVRDQRMKLNWEEQTGYIEYLMKSGRTKDCSTLLSILPQVRWVVFEDSFTQWKTMSQLQIIANQIHINLAVGAFLHAQFDGPGNKKPIRNMPKWWFIWACCVRALRSGT